MRFRNKAKIGLSAAAAIAGAIMLTKPPNRFPEYPRMNEMFLEMYEAEENFARADSAVRTLSQTRVGTGPIDDLRLYRFQQGKIADSLSDTLNVLTSTPEYRNARFLMGGSMIGGLILCLSGMFYGANTYAKHEREQREQNE